MPNLWEMTFENQFLKNQDSTAHNKRKHQKKIKHIIRSSN